MKTAVCVCVCEPEVKQGQKGQNLKVWVQRQLAPTLLPVQVILVTIMAIMLGKSYLGNWCCNYSCWSSLTSSLLLGPFRKSQLSADLTTRHLRISSDLEYYSRIWRLGKCHSGSWSLTDVAGPCSKFPIFCRSNSDNLTWVDCHLKFLAIVKNIFIQPIADSNWLWTKFISRGLCSGCSVADSGTKIVQKTCPPKRICQPSVHFSKQSKSGSYSLNNRLCWRKIRIRLLDGDLVEPPAILNHQLFGTERVSVGKLIRTSKFCQTNKHALDKKDFCQIWWAWFVFHCCDLACYLFFLPAKSVADAFHGNFDSAWSQLWVWLLLLPRQLLLCDHCFCDAGGRQHLHRPQWTFSRSRPFFHPRCLGLAEREVTKRQSIHLIDSALFWVGQWGPVSLPVKGHKNRHHNVFN